MKDRFIVLMIVILALVLAFGTYYIFTQRSDTKLTTDNLQLTTMGTLKLTSTAFQHNEMIPSLYTCDGEDISPPLQIEGVPEEAKSLVLIMDDPDATGGRTWDHWVVFNLQPVTDNIQQGKEPDGVAGKNSWGRTGYGGPCPGSGTHRYFFKLYALDTVLDLPESSTKAEIEEAMVGHVLDKTEMIGLYKRQ